jgi:hypothetical protein
MQIAEYIISVSLRWWSCLYQYLFYLNTKRASARSLKNVEDRSSRDERGSETMGRRLNCYQFHISSKENLLVETNTV